MVSGLYLEGALISCAQISIIEVATTLDLLFSLWMLFHKFGSGECGTMSSAEWAVVFSGDNVRDFVADECIAFKKQCNDLLHHQR